MIFPQSRFGIGVSYSEEKTIVLKNALITAPLFWRGLKSRMTFCIR